MNLMNITVVSSLPLKQRFTELRYAYLPHSKDICVVVSFSSGLSLPPLLIVVQAMLNAMLD